MMRTDAARQDRCQWSAHHEDNVDPANPLELSLYVPPDARIERATLQFHCKPFRPGQTNPDMLAPVASGVSVKINGADVTGALGAPADAAISPDLEITAYVRAGAWNEIEIGSATLGRLEAIAVIDAWLPRPADKPETDTERGG